MIFRQWQQVLDGTKMQVIGVVIDILKWVREPLFHLYQTVYRLRLRSDNLLVRFQFKYHDLRKK
jgi:hypothetical protein